MKTFRFTICHISCINLYSFIVLILFSTSLYSQNKNKTEKDNLSEDNLKKQKIHSLFDLDKKTYSNQLIKFNLLDLVELSPTISYEHRIGKNFSMETHMKFKILDFEDEGFREFQGLLLEQNFKYFHNYKNRLRKGKNINGFSANYFALYGYFIVADRYHSFYQSINTSVLTFVEPSSAIGLKYGIHRRISNFGYLDAFIGVHPIWEHPLSEHSIITTRKVNLILGIRAGFALDSFKDLKRIF